MVFLNCIIQNNIRSNVYYIEYRKLGENMKYGIMRRAYNDIIDKIFQKYNLIKEIDFNNDIEVEKSGKFIIDNEGGYLEFLFQKKEEITINDYTTIFGKMETHGEDVKMIPVLNDKFEDLSQKSVSLVLEKIFMQTEMDVIYIKFNKTKDSYFYFRPSNFAFYNAMHKLKSGNKNKNLYHSYIKDCKTIECIFKDDSVTIAKRVGLELDSNTAIRLPLSDNTIEFTINKRTGYVRAGNKKANIPFLSIIREEKMCIGLLSFVQDDVNLNETACIKSILYGTEYGYIYINTFEIQSKVVELIMISSGNPVIQYYVNESNQWVNITKNLDIHINGNTQLRIKMATGDKVYKIFIVEKINKNYNLHSSIT